MKIINAIDNKVYFFKFSIFSFLNKYKKIIKINVKTKGGPRKKYDL